MSVLILQKIIFTSVLFFFVFGLSVNVCKAMGNPKLEKICVVMAVLNIIFILASLLILLWI